MGFLAVLAAEGVDWGGNEADLTTADWSSLHNIRYDKLFKDRTFNLSMHMHALLNFTGGFFGFFTFLIQQCFICRPSDSTVSEDAGIELRTGTTLALAVGRSNHSARSPLFRLDLICTRLDLFHTRLDVTHKARSHPHSTD